MKYSITMANNVGKNAPIVLRGSYQENIKIASQMGYDAVEIHVNDPCALDINAILTACQKNNICVSTIGTGMGYTIDGLSFTDPDDDVREKAVARILDHIKVASEFGAKVIIGSMRGKIPDTDNREKLENRALDCFKKILDFAEKKQITVLNEAINRYETNFINNVKEGLSLINRLKSRYLKLHLDTFHMNIEEQDMLDSIVRAGENLGHIHFADSDRWYPGHGHIDFKSILKALRKINYNGYIAFECLPLPEPAKAAEKSIKYLKSIE